MRLVLFVTRSHLTERGSAAGQSTHAPPKAQDGGESGGGDEGGAGGINGATAQEVYLSAPPSPLLDSPPAAGPAPPGTSRHRGALSPLLLGCAAYLGMGVAAQVGGGSAGPAGAILGLVIGLVIGA